MKLVHLYLIGVFIMIAFLVGSTMWQFNQFQGNVKNLQFGLPQELTQNVPDANQQLSQMMAQMQTQMQGGAPSPAGEPAAPTENKTWTAPDGAFSFEYPADWTAMPLDQPVESAEGKILFSAYKTAATGMPSINSLSVEESTFATAQELMEKIETDLRAKNIPAKITRGEIINSNQTIPLVETEYSFAAPMMNIRTEIREAAAIIEANQKIYLLHIAAQGNAEDNDNIFKSVIINNEPNANQIK